jgi:glycosyltransferase involved in cell wall biosynthesis
VKIGILLPCRNEEKNLLTLIPQIIERAVARNLEFSLILCEGNSSDNTWVACQKLSVEFPKYVRTIKQRNKGKFDAIVCGIESNPSDYYLIWDSDNTIDLDSGFVLLEQALKQPSSVFIGNRFTDEIGTDAIPRIRYLGNICFAFLWRICFSQKIPDLLCGLKGFPSSLSSRINEVHTKYDFYGDLTVLALAAQYGIPTNSIDVKYRARTYGKTNIGLLTGSFRLLKSFYFAFIHLKFYKH